MKFFPAGEGGKGEMKCTTETIMLLYPFYLDYQAKKDREMKLNERKMSLMILKDLVGDVSWYRKEMQGEKGDDRGGFDINKAVLINCKHIIEDKDYCWCPPRYRFSSFLHRVLTGEFDTDRLSEFARFVSNQSSAKENDRINRKIWVKFGYSVTEDDDDDEGDQNESETFPTNKAKQRTKNAKMVKEKTKETTSQTITEGLPVNDTPDSQLRRSSRNKNTANNNNDNDDEVTGIDNDPTTTSSDSVTTTTKDATTKDDTTSKGKSPTTTSSDSVTTTTKDATTKDDTTTKDNESENETTNDDENGTNVPNSNVSEKPQKRPKPKKKHEKLKEDIERFIKDPDAVVQNKAKIIELLFKAASRLDEDRGSEVDVNFLKSISLDKNVLQNFMGYKWLSSKIQDIIRTDENLTTGNSNSSLSTKEGNSGNSDSGDNDDDEKDDNDMESGKQKRKHSTNTKQKNAKKQKGNEMEASSHSQITEKTSINKKG
jgi:hypothetical protein